MNRHPVTGIPIANYVWAGFAFGWAGGIVFMVALFTILH